MRGRLFTVLAVALLAASVPAYATAAEAPWTPVEPALTVPDNLSTVGLFDVAATSPADVWAVGSAWTDTEQPLITHWTGAGWSVADAPKVPNFQYGFAGVDAVSARDVWAVGNGMDLSSTDFGFIPVIAHYDGRTWSRVPSPTPASSDFHVLIGVDMVSATDGWAVGWRQGPLTDPSQPLVLRWRNGRWVTVSVPRIDGAKLAHVHARAANDIWAVGTQDDSGLIMHFDGTRWTQLSVPPGSGTDTFTQLRSVTGVSAGDAWAVGSACVLHDEGTACQPFIMRLSGGVWRVVPASGDGGTNLQDVVARSRDDVWVVGYDLPLGGAKESNHVEHWDGRRFTTVPADSGSFSILGQLASALEGVTRLPGTDELWAVGWQESGPQVIRHD